MRPIVALLVGPLLLTGCARAALQYGRDGLAPVDRVMRADLESGRFGSAYEAAFSRDVAARDRLLRALTVGTLGLYASRTDSSVWALDRAWSLTDDRRTKKVGNAAASLVVNDYALPYVPGATEQLFIPFYGALSWFSRGERDEAAVEARRLTQLLGVAPEDGDHSTAAEVRGLLHYVAGAVFDAAGDHDEAEVAYRNAARLVTVPVRRDTTAPDSLSGDVVVVLEQGFVGHPVPFEETVLLSSDEYGMLRAHDDGVAFRTADAIRVREGMRRYGPYDRHSRLQMGVSINWSEFANGRPVASALSIATAGAGAGAVNEVVSLHGSGNVSRAVRADFERGQPARFTRALIRAAGRAALVTVASDQLARADDDARRGRDGHDGRDAGKNGKDDSDASAVGHVLAGLGLFGIAAASEVNDRGDLRSWNLLPHDLRVLRLRLPAGEQEVRAMVDGQEIIVGRATVRPGQVTLLAQRLFRAPSRAGLIAGGN